MKLSRSISILLVALLLLPLSVLSGQVQFSESGSLATLSNESISMVLHKERHEVVSLKIGEREYLDTDATRGYFQRVSGGQYTEPSVDQFSVIRHDSEIIEVMMKQNPTVAFPFVMNTHFILRAGESGFYVFSALEYPLNSPASEVVNLEQFNFLLRISPSLFRKKQITAEIWETMPTIGDMQASTQVMDATYEMPPGSIYTQLHRDVYTKYDMALDFSEPRVYGAYGGGYGLWMIVPSSEDLNGAPLAQELTVHQTHSTPALLKLMTGAHFGSGILQFDLSDRGWRKLFGPWFVYLNEGADREAAWSDAESTAVEHVGQWPYSWMDHRDYPMERGQLTGSLSITDGTTAAGTLVFLAQPEGDQTPNWQQQGKDYVFWDRVDESGSFTVSDIRAGEYMLYMIQKGVADEFKQAGFSIVAGESKDVGLIEWSPLRYGETLWQIGIPDRDSTEFRGGDEFRNWGGYQLDRYAERFPDGIHYSVGESDWTTDWNFLQPAKPLGGGEYGPSTWRVTFKNDHLMEGDAYLRLGIAGSRGSRLAVILNDEFLLNRNLNSGQGFPRSGSRGFHEELVVHFDASILREGMNELSLVQSIASQWMGIHYDFVRMEVPKIVDNEFVWNGFAVDEDGVVDTGTLIGRVDVNLAPWVWSFSLEVFLYIENDFFVKDRGLWMFVHSKQIHQDLDNVVESLEGEAEVVYPGELIMVLPYWFYSSELKHWVYFPKDSWTTGRGGWTYVPFQH